jgi:phospholipase A1
MSLPGAECLESHPEQTTRATLVMLASRRPLLATACAVVLFFPAVVAADNGTLSSCKHLLEESERLACYDNVSGFVAPAPAPSAVVQRSLIEEAWASGPGADRYALRYFRPNYLLPAQYTDDVNQEPFTPVFEAAASDQELDNFEVQFQISAKARVWATDDLRWGLWAAYTQQSWWQAYSSEKSAPFRETNYEPEVIVSYRPDVTLGSFQWRLFNFGVNHQSNGRSQVLSRSWDRVITEIGIERNNLALLARGWYRIPESSNDDDNPDIDDYLGHGDLTLIYKWGEHSFSLMGRGNWNTGNGAAQFAWTTPRLLGPMRGYVQLFSGYGESMIDYNFSQTTIGIGITLNDTL